MTKKNTLLVILFKQLWYETFFAKPATTWSVNKIKSQKVWEKVPAVEN